MKELYTKPELQVVSFDTKDVVSTSIPSLGDGDDD